MESAISYATQFMRDLPRQWTDHTLENKQRFQQIVFPDGVIYDKKEGCRTAKIGYIYELLQESDARNFDLVSRIELEP